MESLLQRAERLLRDVEWRIEKRFTKGVSENELQEFKTTLEEIIEDPEGVDDLDNLILDDIENVVGLGLNSNEDKKDELRKRD